MKPTIEEIKTLLKDFDDILYKKTSRSRVDIYTNKKRYGLYSDCFFIQYINNINIYKGNVVFTDCHGYGYGHNDVFTNKTCFYWEDEELI